MKDKYIDELATILTASIILVMMAVLNYLTPRWYNPLIIMAMLWLTLIFQLLRDKISQSLDKLTDYLRRQ